MSAAPSALREMPPVHRVCLLTFIGKSELTQSGLSHLNQSPDKLPDDSTCPWFPLAGAPGIYLPFPLLQPRLNYRY